MLTGPQRLILICSGRYEYAEVELTGALQIVGPNNTGKTTLINTLQFLYLNDRRQMDFGSYSPEQTREFYFPSQYSYILFECLGATGQCVVGWRGQSRTTGGEPERFCHLGPFDPVDFLDEKNQVREPRDVNLRLALKQLRTIKSAEEHKELLLSPTGDDKRGFGIVSLRDPDKYHQFRETLKNLLTLTAITQEQMRDRLLMLADIPPDRTAFDARELFGNDYDRIRARREKLVKFKTNQILVEKLVNTFNERETMRGELIWRWTDLRGKKAKFEQEHEVRLVKRRNERDAKDAQLSEIDAELKDRRENVNNFSVQQGKVSQQLESLSSLDKEFSEFIQELECTALGNLNQEISKLQRRLDDAEGESREKARQKLDQYGVLVKQKEQTIAHFDKLAVTALRKHFSDDELNSLFRILNPELLEIPVGSDGVTVKRERELLAALRGLHLRVRGDVYHDGNVSFTIPSSKEPLGGLENIETVREQLAEYNDILTKWKAILAAIEQREVLEEELKRKGAERDTKARQMVRYEEYQKLKSGKPRLLAELEKVNAAITAAQERIKSLTTQRKVAEKARTQADDSIRSAENDFNVVMGRYESECISPEFPTKARVVDDIPDDFGGAIELFLRQQNKQAKYSDEIEDLFRDTERWFGDEFRGQDESETVRNLHSELDALADKEDALARDWNAHLHGLKATFDQVLRSLGRVINAANDLNRDFARVRVSDLKAIKLDVVEQSDLVNWIRQLAQTEQPGLFDDDTTLNATLKNFRSKLEGNPVIRFADLFTLGFTVTGADDRRHTYHDFRQIESHGTTITIKVLFNLLLLKGQLRRDDCAVPFFLDEIQALDTPNRHAILTTARQLGFIAITAAPEAVSEVDVLYFLQPQRGRIVLSKKHRFGVNRATVATS